MLLKRRRSWTAGSILWRRLRRWHRDQGKVRHRVLQWSRCNQLSATQMYASLPVSARSICMLHSLFVVFIHYITPYLIHCILLSQIYIFLLHMVTPLPRSILVRLFPLFYLLFCSLSFCSSLCNLCQYWVYHCFMVVVHIASLKKPATLAAFIQWFCGSLVRSQWLIISIAR